MPRWCQAVVCLGLLAPAPGCGAGNSARVVAGFDAVGVHADWEAPRRGTPGYLRLRFSDCGHVERLARHIAALPPVPVIYLEGPCGPDVLRGATGLRELFIAAGWSTDITVVRQFSGLEHLDILAGTSRAIVDVSALDGHRSLEFLDLRIGDERGENFVGVEQLRTLPKLRLLYLRGHQNLRRLDSISTFPELMFLELPRSGVTDLSPLAAAARLTSLDVSDTAVVDITALASISTLRTLVARGTGIRDLGPLRETALSSLYIDETEVHDLAPLATMTGLHKLGLAGLNVSDIGPLAGLSYLVDLDLSATAVANCSALAGLSSLIVLELRGTPMTDIECVRGLRKLEKLSLGRSVTSLEALRGHPAVRVLYLTVRTADTVEVLRTLPALASVHLGEGSFTAAELDRLRQRRPNLHVAVEKAR